MTLYVVEVPDPAPGQDWQATVPGQYLYDITTIHATLRTAAAADALPDVSGNGNNGTYRSTGPFGSFVPGLLPGDQAWQPAAPPGVPHYDRADIPHGLADWLSPFTIAYWQKYDPAEIGGGTQWLLTLDAALSGIFSIFGQAQAGGPGTQPLTFNGFGSVWIGPPNAITTDGLPHHIAFTWDLTDLTLYVDGAVLAWATVVLGGLSASPADTAQLGDPDVGAGTFDELGIFPAALTAGQIATLYLAGSIDADTYATAVLSLSPTAFYRLDGAGGAIGRTPALEVTDGTTTVVRIGDGFPAAAVPGPYKYTWQLNLPADTQSADGTITTVGTPRLIIPAGYTIGSRTPDIAAGDQWSNVVIWWDDTVQKLTLDFPDYEYPPGAFYTYQQIGSPS